VARERLTLAGFLSQWLEWLKTPPPKVRPRTLTSYGQLVTQHLIPALGRILLAKLGPKHVDSLLHEKTASGLSARTVQYLHAVLRRALNQALKWDLIPRNVVTLVDPPKVQRPEIQPWAPEEARRFLAEVKGDRLEAIYSVAISCGLRQGEALGLQWQHVDLDNGVIQVREQLQRIDGKLRLADLKTDKSRRAITLPAVTLSALHTHRARQERERQFAGARWQDTGLVFTTTVGTGIDQRNLLRHFYAAIQRAGVRRVRWHDLRHCAASLLLAQGVPMKAVADTLGHSDIRLTMNLYAHLFPEAKREIAERMDAVLAPVAPSVAPEAATRKPS